jgi:hypothetical protein
MAHRLHGTHPNHGITDKHLIGRLEYLQLAISLLNQITTALTKER